MTSVTREAARGRDHGTPGRSWWLPGLQGRERSGDAGRTSTRSSASTRAELFAFIEETQRPEWERLVKAHGGEDERRSTEVRAAARAADRRAGHGRCPAPRSPRPERRDPAVLPQARVRAGAGAGRALRREPPDGHAPAPVRGRTRARRVDLCLFVNGIPVATAELKNPLTGQNIEHAIEQYRTDRDPKNVTLGRRALVHFAVDPDSVAMTTKLEGKATRFLPFNRGHNLGQGQPAEPRRPQDLVPVGAGLGAGTPGSTSCTASSTSSARRRARSAARRAAETVIFPRYHQWDAVLKLEADAGANGAGHSYLVQHSAGSGKSNTIAWLAHRLSTLHDAEDRKVFDKVVVITDRVILDRQLQDTIYQFEHAHGVVVKIDKDSGAARRGAGRRAGADHHHDAAEVPVRARQDRRRCRPAATRS